MARTAHTNKTDLAVYACFGKCTGGGHADVTIASARCLPMQRRQSARARAAACLPPSTHTDTEPQTTHARHLHPTGTWGLLLAHLLAMEDRQAPYTTSPDA